jgi:hypothetical protein
MPHLPRSHLHREGATHGREEIGLLGQHHRPTALDERNAALRHGRLDERGACDEAAEAGNAPQRKGREGHEPAAGDRDLGGACEGGKGAAPGFVEGARAQALIA